MADEEVAALVIDNGSGMCKAGFAGAEGSPVGKVIEMLSDLQAKVIKEGEATQKTYEEFSTWCEERSGELQREITTVESFH